jgi:Ser-tRNA(Ala) deacylase AlaX
MRKVFCDNPYQQHLLPRVASDSFKCKLRDEHGLAVGNMVELEIDWKCQYKLMRLYFAAELILALIKGLRSH